MAAPGDSAPEARDQYPHQIAYLVDLADGVAGRNANADP